jgi:hypothetical protein
MPYIIKAQINLEILKFSLPLLCYLNFRRITYDNFKKKVRLANQEKECLKA